MLKKRALIKATAGAGALLSTGKVLAQSEKSAEMLSNMALNAKPITRAEREQRVAKAQSLMQQQDINMLVIEGGTALNYFTGIRWGRSERFTGVVIPREGQPVVITPFFEEPSVRETVGIDVGVRTWNEDDNPFALVAGLAKEWGLTEGQIAIEETVRHFISDGIAQVVPGSSVVSGMSVTRGVRMYKTSAEIALMQTASDITMAAYKHIHSKVEVGMDRHDISALMRSATSKLGGSNKFAMALINEASAYPHGTQKLQTVSEGSVILMDCGCSVHDYRSDISRTWVIGEPSKKQRRVWNTAKAGQELALETAQIGVPAGEVDRTVRAFYEKEGFGPGYQLPGLSHRLGHGIGMDGHEPVNFVLGEKTPLAPGMCFSDEPGIYLPGEFGVRLEDCLYMTESGPKLFTEFSPSIDKPFG